MREKKFNNMVMKHNQLMEEAEHVLKQRNFENCLKCKFYLTQETNYTNNILNEKGVPHETRGVSKVGICRRFPAHVCHEPNDWCGEFQPIKETANTNQEEI